MKRRVFFVLCFLPLLAACATEPFGLNEGRKVPEDFFGIAPFRRTLTPEDFSLINNLGVVWQRRTCRWSALEPERGIWDFSDWDNYVRDSKNAGKKLLAILAYDTLWVHEGGSVSEKIGTRELPYYLNYVRTVVSRYKGMIDAYEIWNEPNTRRFWDGSDEEFITMTRETIKAIRSIDPDVKILAGSFFRVPERFIRRMLRAGVFDEADGLSFHPYALSPRGAVKLCDSLLGLLAEEAFNGEVWITEMGYPVRGWYPNRVLDENFPSHVVKTLVSFAARNLKTVFWYELFDAYNPEEYASTLNSEDFFGIAYPNGTVKNAFNAFALCGKNIAGKEYRPKLPERNNLPARTATFYFTGSENVLVIWNESGKSFLAAVTLPGQDRRLYDISSGEYRNMETHNEILISQTPLFFTWSDDDSLETAALVPAVFKIR